MTQYEKILMEEDIKHLIDDNARLTAQARLKIGNKKGLALSQALPYLALKIKFVDEFRLDIVKYQHKEKNIRRDAVNGL